MCGISGFINKNTAKIDMKKIIKNMTDTIEHRGPDGEGYYVNDNIALGHRRLAIIDLNEKANQPLKTDNYILVFNGEIYNYIELKKELREYNYLTSSDSEVILAAYDKWGKACVDHFRGMWSFILYDIKENIIFCSRDRFGIKPFYYYDSEEFIAFASEIKQFTTLPEWKANGNRDRIQDFLVFGVLDHTEETMFRNVNQLLPGHNLVYNLSNNKFKIYEYYNLRNNLKEHNSEEDDFKIFKQLMESSVKEHMTADVPIGSCLSGGLDSSTIVVLMDKILNKNNDSRKIDTISSCFHNKIYDEQEYIDEVNFKVNANEHKVFPKAEELFENMEKIIWHQDEPFGSTSIFAQWNVFRAANDNNIKVMLDGQGADEQLAGYNSFYMALFNELFFKMNFIKLDEEIEAVIANYNYFTKEQIFDRSFKMQLCSLKDILKKRIDNPKRFSKPIFDVYYDYYKGLNDSMKNIREFSFHQLYHSSLPQLLHYEDRNSMTFSIESRVPFLDHRIVEFVLSCNSEKKINNGITKYILRESMKDELPEKIKNRRDKMGFVTPEVEWMKEHKEKFKEQFEIGCIKLGNLIDKDLALIWFDEVMNSKTNFDFTIWRIVCLGKWMEIFNVGDVG
ncbi:MAG: asparagine synthase (glutamine-hydrolyzing) [Clostridium beijerinckii]|jgi:asparagine synthase (glutamine-hydrolysing)|uniref:asparagine synthase (glutamine-hydrolyzing) n=1 Tax=Clostridium beijerinckii TaxID=1520 RepID=UPI0014946F7F|nr:asparagine synthase (glutamine-hydrolyzing) [Clostridium beijerinckii]MCI1477718.1 asparagine synthase (glutamine-hydrolyzing) [Clostridium beijerinckii]MCI1577966.1 asparagine synthase (glutamine-hydrolyzing) [Clostridium beijerinckii]MCI1583688.1 asparagine synthase (glutamine-hydrolyzing) [Clostridium beijerinckii]MCI1620623.1 asparagine synthase (glutamine-hydrolyzing) [Clostridium beijerinckii]NOW87860.1 asparagine synthase (glutamine-hydrolysing) [Clostridium beijerinckii]